MSLVLNTNLNAMVAQGSLTSSGSSLSTALNQLSSGLRINTAADDAAGYAIVQGMTSQIGGLNQAARNANDGVSLAQTANGALQEITSDLQTMRNLAVQSLNATNSAADRADLDQQFQALSADIDNVAKTANFNGVNLLDGSFSSQVFQTGANAGQTVTVSSIASARTSALGASYAATSGPSTAMTGPLVAGSLTINGTAISASIAGSGNQGQTSASAFSIAQAINSSQNTVTATAAGPTVVGTVVTAAAIPASTFQINGINVGAIAAGTNAAGQAVNDVAAINQISAATGVTASVNAANGISLTTADGSSINITGTVTGTGLTAGITNGTISLTSTSTAGIVIAGATPALAGLTAGTTATALQGVSVALSSVASVTSSNAALSTIDAALQQVAATGAQLGAYQNRFQAAITGLNTNATNLTSARSSIQDTDYAQATSALSKAQILQQASTAMVAQANTVPQNVLSLLQKLP
jgi:flagellin